MHVSSTAAAPRPWFGLVAGLMAISATFAWISLGAESAGSQAAQERAAAAAPPPAVTSIDGRAMGGAWSVTFGRPPAGVTAERLRQDVAGVLEQVEDATSGYRAASAVSRFNAHRGTDWVEVPADLARAVDAARVVSEHSGGAFDVTVGTLVNLWGFGPDGVAAGKVARVPSDAEVAAARSHVDYRRLHARLSPPALKKDDPAIVVDLTGIARGYAAGRVAAALDAAGASDYLIRVGGEVRAHGVSGHGRPWRVAIDAPPADGRDSHGAAGGLVVELRDCGVSTSAEYRAFFEVNGRRYCHEIDTRTGRPVNHRLASVSVIHGDSAYADGMATALMVVGAAEGRAAAERLGVGALFVERGKERFATGMTPGFAGAVVVGDRNPHAGDGDVD